MGNKRGKCAGAYLKFRLKRCGCGGGGGNLKESAKGREALIDFSFQRAVTLFWLHPK